MIESKIPDRNDVMAPTRTTSGVDGVVAADDDGLASVEVLGVAVLDVMAACG